MGKLDPRALRPTELARLLNSTPLGEVISTRTIYRHRNRAGYRVGDGTTMDLVRYAAWVARKKHEGGDDEGPQSYEERKDKIARQERARSKKGRDIAPPCTEVEKETIGAASPETG